MVNSIHSKIITVSFVLILGLMLVMILFDLSRMKVLQEKLEVIVKEHSVKTGLMMTMRTGIYERQVSLRNILLMEDIFQRDQGKMLFNNFAANIIQARNNFSKMPLNEKERIILDEINQAMGVAYSAQVKLVDKSIYQNDVKITQEEIKATFVTQEVFIQSLDKMIKLQKEATQNAVLDAEKSYSDATKSVYILGGSALLLGSLVAFFIIRLTKAQADEVNHAMTELEVSRERLEERVKIRTAELAQARDEALASNKSKDTFLATMSHELRTPLNIIVGYSELLEEISDSIDTERLNADLRKIQVAANHQLKLINSLLDISKIEGGKLELAPQDFDIESLLNEINSSATPLMSKNNNNFIIKCRYGIGMMYSDKMRVLQILLNILSNAAKFTIEGEVTLDVYKSKSGDDIVFDVIDNGVGIAEKYLNTLFDEFTQEDSTTTREYGGTGLGLSISRKLAKLLNGDITVKSVKDEGSTFTIKLPIVYVENI